MHVPNKREREAGRRVDLIKDAVRECQARWPDFTTVSKQVEEIRGGLPKPFTLVESRWSVDGKPHGLRDLLRPNAPSSEVRDASRRIAWQALYNAELRKG